MHGEKECRLGFCCNFFLVMFVSESIPYCINV